MHAPSDETDRLYELHAAICKTFANPSRLRIVEALGESELTVSQIVTLLGVSKSNASQHLAIMRDKVVVESRRQGAFVHYRLASPKILQACRLMRDVLVERFEQVGELSRIHNRMS